MPQELRGNYHRELDKLDIALAALLGLIPEAIVSATATVLAGDERGATEVDRWRTLVDELYADVERTAETLVARQAPVAGDLRFLFACVRLVPHLHEAVDLVASIAAPARSSLAGELSGRRAALVDELGQVTGDTWSAVAQLWDQRDGAHADLVATHHDAIGEVRSSLTAEAASGSVSIPIAMEIALLGRCYERLGRHAVQAALRMEPLIPIPRPGS